VLDLFIQIYYFKFIIVFFNKETMLIVSCREVGMDCDYIYKGKTEEEIMKNAD